MSLIEKVIAKIAHKPYIKNDYKSLSQYSSATRDLLKSQMITAKKILQKKMHPKSDIFISAKNPNIINVLHKHGQDVVKSISVERPQNAQNYGLKIANAVLPNA